jgi:hypothetical protein
MSLKQTLRREILEARIEDYVALKKGFAAKSNLSKDKKGYLIAESHGILNTRMIYSCQILNVNGVNNVRHTAIYS